MRLKLSQWSRILPVHLQAKVYTIALDFYKLNGVSFVLDANEP
ncbi:hypothetical protein GP5015_319 [gamma proteobacterium HTCC5015]|nr:hypothetical protein GP5015_319 [gamma proteobacterium HTCC5015]